LNGPASIHLKATSSTVHIVGVCTIIGGMWGNDLANSELLDEEDAGDESSEVELYQEVAKVGKEKLEKKKDLKRRRGSSVSEEVTNFEEVVDPVVAVAVVAASTTTTTNSDAPLSKKARKLEAAKKTLELQNHLQDNGTLSTPVDHSNLSKKEKKQLAKKEEERSNIAKLNGGEKTVAGGVKITDFIIGAGNIPLPGRLISLVYEGSLEDGTVFDKNKNKKAPLKFRLGLGQVIKGLEIGIDGMRVGGERTIIIPSDLGYGKKKQGPIPANSTLTFVVSLLEVGRG